MQTGPSAGSCTERELVTQAPGGTIDLCTPDGHLNRAAVGWSRRPLHRCNLTGRWGRKKRWDYWCVTTDEHLFSLTFADLDYLGLYVPQFLEYRTGRLIELPLALPFAPGLHQPETVAGHDIRFDSLARLGMHAAILEEPGGTRLVAGCRTLGGISMRADIFVAMPSGHETLGVVIPWSDTLFQYTSKHNTRPAHGWVEIDGRRFEFSERNHAYGCLDFGRGIWPYEIVWNWASASGKQDGHIVGLQLGGKWTDGTGLTENALCIDGRLHKLSEELLLSYDRQDFMRPWQIRTPISHRVDLTFTPFYERRAKADLRFSRTEIHQMFGRFSGTVVDDGGSTLHLRDLMGWAEEHRARW